MLLRWMGLCVSALKRPEQASFQRYYSIVSWLQAASTDIAPSSTGVMHHQIVQIWTVAANLTSQPPPRW